MAEQPESVPLHIDRMDCTVVSHPPASPLPSADVETRLFEALARFAQAEEQRRG